MNKYSEHEAQELFDKDIKRFQVAIALYCGMTTGRRFREVLGHSSREISTAYQVPSSAAPLEFRERPLNERITISHIRYQSALRRVFALLYAKQFECSTRGEIPNLKADWSSPVSRRANEPATALLRQHEQLGRVDALSAHLAALNEQLRPSA
jgi:hypothetical protein